VELLLLLLSIKPLFDSANATAATFFANAIDTQSKGIDVVIRQSYHRNGLTLKTDLSGTISNKRVGAIKLHQY
jgi:iron complex outermembrane receptor protein